MLWFIHTSICLDYHWGCIELQFRWKKKGVLLQTCSRLLKYSDIALRKHFYELFQEFKRHGHIEDQRRKPSSSQIKVLHEDLIKDIYRRDPFAVTSYVSDEIRSKTDLTIPVSTFRCVLPKLGIQSRPTNFVQMICELFRVFSSI